MPFQPRLVACAVALVLVGCTGAEESPDTTIMGSDSAPAQVVSDLLSAIEEGRFEDAADVTDLDQAALLTLVEGANATEVVAALTDEAVQTGSNFWSGFAQTVDGFAPGSVTVSEGESVTQGHSHFVMVSVLPEQGDPRVFVVRRTDDAWVIDLFATFGSTLSERLLAPVETVLASANPDAAVVRTRLGQSADSLLVAAADPNLPSSAHQSLLALIERVTRTPG